MKLKLVVYEDDCQTRALTLKLTASSFARGLERARALLFENNWCPGTPFQLWLGRRVVHAEGGVGLQ
jgi:hypothetical protein